LAKTAFLFPGQGAQYVGMGRSLLAQCDAAAALFERASSQLGYDLAEVCLNGPAARLNSTQISQPAIFVLSLASLEALRAAEPHLVDECVMAAGLSLGEYSALVFAGALSFEEGLRVVQTRGRAMQQAAEATSSGMVSVLVLGRDQVAGICRQAAPVGLVEIANELCPGNVVVSGAMAACQRVVELVEAAGGKTVPLAVAGAFHTSIMKPADEVLEQVLATVSLNQPRLAVYSNVDAKPHENPEEIRRILVRQVLSPVKWEDCIRGMLAAGAEQFIELGPGRVLKGLLKRIDRKVPCRALDEPPA
jgi:[acyl-carrier-protein] S-malonyltransferase